MPTSSERQTRLQELFAAAVPPEGDVLLVVPPFSDVSMPPLGPHLLQAHARHAGFRASVLHANASFAHWIGIARNREVLRGMGAPLLGERIFSAAAYDLPILGTDRGRLAAALAPAALEACEEIAAEAPRWADALAAAVAGLRYRVVGCTSMFEQTSASVALLRRIKALQPETRTLIGGANCEGPMAAGVASLTDKIDFIFSGESDRTFPALLRQLSSGSCPGDRIVQGQPILELDTLPTPSFEDFFAQMEVLFPYSAETSDLWKIELPLESSRGCWWGQKHHCTFCGLNGLAMGYRKKSAGRVVQELGEVVAECSGRLTGRDWIRISMTDNIMPHEYFRTLLPRLAAEPTRARIFYEQKANLTLQRVMALAAAGIDAIQPGIESLSTSFLQRMKKGVTAPQNIALLRYATSVGVFVGWNLLTHFPGDERHELEQMLSLLPLMRHLAPPEGVHPLVVSRFSPYFEEPGAHGLSNLRPLEGMAGIYPPGTPTWDLAFAFAADYECASARHRELVDEIKREVDGWREAWRPTGARRPLLKIQRPSALYRESAGKELVLVDTRGIPGTVSFRSLTRGQARSLVSRRGLDDSFSIDWAVRHRLGFELDGWYVPLATADPGLLLELEGNGHESGSAFSSNSISPS